MAVLSSNSLVGSMSFRSNYSYEVGYSEGRNGDSKRLMEMITYPSRFSAGMWDIEAYKAGHGDGTGDLHAPEEEAKEIAQQQFKMIQIEKRVAEKYRSTIWAV